jgi:hypothetical protein
MALNMMPLTGEQLDKLIELSGCDTNWSAQRMQRQIKAYLVKNSKNPAGELHTQETIGKHGFGWLGEPGDQSLDSWRFYLGLRSGETLAETVIGLVPPDFQIGGIPLLPRLSLGIQPKGNRLGITRDDIRRTIRDIEAQVPDTMREIRSQVMRDAPTYGLSPTDVESQMRELEAETRRQIRGMEEDVWREVELNP